MIKGHKIERKEETGIFLERIRLYADAEIECTSHTFFRLNGKQRKVFKCGDIKRIILK